MTSLEQVLTRKRSIYTRKENPEIREQNVMKKEVLEDIHDV